MIQKTFGKEHYNVWWSDKHLLKMNPLRPNTSGSTKFKLFANAYQKYHTNLNTGQLISWNTAIQNQTEPNKTKPKPRNPVASNAAHNLWAFARTQKVSTLGINAHIICINWRCINRNWGNKANSRRRALSNSGLWWRRCWSAIGPLVIGTNLLSLH